MSKAITTILETRTKGWTFPYKSKKAHYFIERQSLCKKYKINEYDEMGLLPSTALYQQECCKKCLKKLQPLKLEG